MDYQYRNDVYYVSLAFGFTGAACFLGLTLLGKLLQYCVWNYGCCSGHCCCCKDQLPPKTKRLTKVVDSIETYRIQQLDQLRENYNQHSQRIRDNYTLQMEKVRDNYSNQIKSVKEMKNMGSAGVQGLKDQYNDQISKLREYSSGQLDRCHENYIFQRQRLRKFSAQNYLRVRETKMYTQKTLNRVLDNMPALYLDLSSCKQGLGDQDLREWQEEMDKRENEMKDILNIDLPDLQGDEEDSPSLYYTPSETPLREPGSPFADTGAPLSPLRKVHKRGVSSLSNFLPFWWGNSQPDTVETVAIVEVHPEVETNNDNNVNNNDTQLTDVVVNSPNSNNIDALSPRLASFNSEGDIAIGPNDDDVILVSKSNHVAVNGQSEEAASSQSGGSTAEIDQLELDDRPVSRTEKRALLDENVKENGGVREHKEAADHRHRMDPVEEIYISADPSEMVCKV